MTKSIESPVVVTPPVQKLSVSDAQFAAAVVSHIEEQTNDYRIKSDLQALKPDDVLQKIAESYSATMLENNFFSHADKNGCDVICRLESHEYKAFSWGENLAQIKFSQTPTALEVSTSFMQGWKKSAGHRKNLLSAKFTHQGVGVAVSKNAVYVTVNFSEPKK